MPPQKSHLRSAKELEEGNGDTVWEVVQTGRFNLYFFFLRFFETGFYYVAPTDLELTV